MFFRESPLFFAVTREHLIEIDAQVFALARQAEEKILQGKIVKDGNARSGAHRLDDSRVITMVVANVINDRVELAELFVDRLGCVVNAFKLREQRLIGGT